ncbi:MAG: hypothetical protein JRG80_19880, partial [Deltaproteobacteria bacterium]|nr:hypothetical protein [Deltaproteobacteria bacterium]
MGDRRAADRDASPASGKTLGAAWSCGLWVVFVAIGLLLYRAALDGPFINDDRHYLTANVYTAEANLENVVAILDPTGPAKLTTVNYAPVHLLFSMAERTAFGDATRGYHVVNVLLHAINCVVLIALLMAGGLARAPALIGGLLFAVHPANVEAVGWISQSKTLLAFGLCVGALLLLHRRPLWATVCYALALLTKFLALPIVFVAAALAWARPAESARAHTVRWLVVWVAIALLVAVPQVGAFLQGGAFEYAPFEDPAVQFRTIAAIGARYLVMASTGYGVACFHEPLPVLTWTNRWWLLSLPLAVFLLGCLVVSLRARSPQGAFWVMAATSFAPISQVWPFFYGMADRYLYFILPGLIGGAWLLCEASIERFACGRARALRRAAAGFLLLLAAWFALGSLARAPLWSDDDYVYLDAARAYPRGSSARYIEAVNAAHAGDVRAAVAALRAGEGDRPLSEVRPLSADPRLAPLFGTREFADYVRELAVARIELARRGGYETPSWLRSVGSAHEALGHYDEAIAVYERAIRMEPPEKSILLRDLERARRARR